LKCSGNPNFQTKDFAKQIKCLGATGFLFFFIKDLLWLIVLALTAYFAW
jgi:hypothetical protein